MIPECSIFISCYNEREFIIPTLETVVGALSRQAFSWEILVIDDCSKDDLVARIETFKRSRPELPIRLVVHEINRGIAYTVSEAAGLATGRYFWYVAGDNPVPEETCATLFARIGTADIIIPYVVRYIGRTYSRRIISKLYGTIVRLLSGSKIKYFNGSSIYLREDFLKFGGRPLGFSYSADILISLTREGHSYVEVPVLYTERVSGRSTALNLKNFVEVARFFGRLVGQRFRRPRTTTAHRGVIGGGID